MMAALGGRAGVAQLPGNTIITGFAAWFLWRSYYLLRLPGLDRKLRVAFDWTLELLFPRDTAVLRFGEKKAAASDQEMAPRS
jgi:NADH dehydrogenase